MKKACLLMTIAIPMLAYAQCPDRWLPIKSAEVGREVCFDLGNVVSKDRLKQVTAMSSWRSPQAIDDVHYLSVVQSGVFDCANKKAAIAKMEFFSDRNGQGRSLREINFDPKHMNWDQQVPEISVSTWATICMATPVAAAQ